MGLYPANSKGQAYSWDTAMTSLSVSIQHWPKVCYYPAICQTLILIE
jgi:hypothetical protein